MTEDNVTMKSDDFSMLFEAEIPEVKRMNRMYFRLKMHAKYARGSIYTLCLKIDLEYDSQWKPKKIKIFQLVW